jgi:excisionase family DNA binding protein
MQITKAEARSPLLTVPEVAAHLGVSRQHVYRLISEGRLPAVRLSERRLRVPRPALEAWLQMQANRAVEALR